MPVLDRCGTDPARTEREDPPAGPAARRVSLRGRYTLAGVLRAEGALSTMRSWTGRRDAEVTCYGAEETSNPQTRALQAGKGDRRRCAAGRWASELGEWLTAVDCGCPAPSAVWWPQCGPGRGWPDADKRIRELGLLSLRG